MEPCVYVIGVGMTKFCQPKTAPHLTYPEMAKISGTSALNDAGIDYNQVDGVVASYCYGEPTAGQRAVYELGLTGVPVFNVNNNCSSASSAIMLARYLVQSGSFNCVLALGFEQMEGGLSERFPEKVSPVSRHFEHMDTLSTKTADAPPLKRMTKMTQGVIRLYAEASLEYLEANPKCEVSDFAKIAVKNRRMGRMNGKACFYGAPALSEDVVMNTGVLCPPITSHMSAFTADGSAAAILCSAKFLRSAKSPRRAVQILDQAMVTDLPSSFQNSLCNLSGFDMAQRAAQQCYRKLCISANDIDVFEVHDCFAPNELFMYEALGLCPKFDGHTLIRSGQWKRNNEGGEVFSFKNRWVVNSSGGLEAKGHPIGATGLAQCYELTTQLRNEAGIRQVPNVKRAMQHNFGIGGAAVVSVYGLPEPNHSSHL